MSGNCSVQVQLGGYRPCARRGTVVKPSSTGPRLYCTQHAAMYTPAPPSAPRPITLTREQGEEIEYALNRGANLVDEECGQGTATSDYLRSALSVLRSAMSEKGEGR
jgi:hypothetical protein